MGRCARGNPSQADLGDSGSSIYLTCVRKYRKKALCEEPDGPMAKSDHLMLISGHKFGQVLGIAYTYAICGTGSAR